MLQGLFRCQSNSRVDLKALLNEVYQMLVVDLAILDQLHSNSPGPLSRVSWNPALFRANYVPFFAIEELVSLSSIPEHVLRWQSNLEAKHLNKLILIASVEDWPTGEELDHDAAEGPHVDWVRVGHAESDFRATIESRLDIGETIFELGAG